MRLINTKPIINMKIKAIVFDLDGVLVNSEDAWYHIHKTIFESKGLHVPDKKEWARTLWGTDLTVICSKFGFSDKETAETVSVKNGLLLENIDKIKIFAGVPEILNGLKTRGLKLGVVSNNNRSFVEKVLEKFQIKQFFDFIIGDEYGPKPKPDGLLKILGFIGVNKTDAVFVGDTQIDVETGEAAGIRTLIIGNDINNIGDIEKL